MRLNCLPAASVVLLVLVAPTEIEGRQSGPPRIVLEEFRLESTKLTLGEPIVIHARAVGQGVTLGSYLLRTAEEVPKEQAIPGFPLYRSGKYYVTEGGSYFLKDNGGLDRDAETGAFTLEVPTKDWKPGTYCFAFFASVRPAAGPFVAARRDLRVTVREHQVVVEDLGPVASATVAIIRRLEVTPRKIDAGQTVTLTLETSEGDFRGIEISHPYFIAPKEVLRGFVYDSDRKVAFFGSRGAQVHVDDGPLDRDPTPRRVAVEIDTHDWPAGVHHLQVNIVGAAGRANDHRPFAVKVRSPRDRLDVSVEDSYYFAPGTHFEKFIKLRDGSLLCGRSLSTNGGRTWQAIEGGFGVGGLQLEDGRVIGLQYRCLPEEGRRGWYRVERSLSEDQGRSFAMTQAGVHVPQAKAAMGHGPHVGPLFMRSIIERTDRSLVALMAGWFHGDDTPCPYGRGRPYSRSYTCESNDTGFTWRFLGPVAYDEIGSEGYNEGSMRRLPDGKWLAVLRTGSEKDPRCQDNPIMWTVSHDEGRTWTSPERTGAEGAFPSLAVLSDGQVVMSYGRPGAMLVFSADGGRTWTDPTVVDETPYSGYTDVVEIRPGQLLVGFGTRGYIDEKTGTRSDQLRLARVHYQPAR